MKLSDFNYHLPKSSIAQQPAHPRDSSRLMVLGRVGSPVHRRFSDLPRFLKKGDVLVVNEAKVVKARFFARKPTGGKVECLFIERRGDGMLLQLGGKNLGAGMTLSVGEDALDLVKSLGEGRYAARPSLPADDFLQKHGSMPLPPYIREYRGDEGRYQTVYAARPGAVAAPTAGLHFTPELLERLEGMGVEVVRLFLKVGPGTFQPVRTENVEEHRMESEEYRIPPETARLLEDAVSRGRRVITVGTTTMRALESSYDGASFRESGQADLFIRPGYRFRFPHGGLVTNFHLPKSTLLMLVSAYAGRERVLQAYETAVREGYRFYSFGDAMFFDHSPEEVECSR